MSKPKKKEHFQPRDTSKEDPTIHMLGMMSDGSTRYIEDQERQGQTQLAASTTIPAKLNGCTEEDLRALGFELEPKPTSGDLLFRPAMLPHGWKIVPTSHAMWSDLVDSRGFIRGSIFYKAAFYDRSAHLGLSVRLHVHEDYDARKRDGTLAYDIYADMPGKTADDGNRKILYRHEHPEKFPDLTRNDSDEIRRRYFQALDDSRGVATEWLKRNYPDYASSSAYWDKEF